MQDVEEYRKKAFATKKERSDKYTTKAVKDKQASGNLSNNPATVKARDYNRKIVEGHVPTRGPRQFKAEGEYSDNDAAQRQRELWKKRRANNVAAAATTDMVIKEGDAF